MYKYRNIVVVVLVVVLLKSLFNKRLFYWNFFSFLLLLLFITTDSIYCFIYNLYFRYFSINIHIIFITIICIYFQAWEVLPLLILKFIFQCLKHTHTHAYDIISNHISKLIIKNNLF